MSRPDLDRAGSWDNHHSALVIRTSTRSHGIAKESILFRETETPTGRRLQVYATFPQNKCFMKVIFCSKTSSILIKFPPLNSLKYLQNIALHELFSPATVETDRLCLLHSLDDCSPSNDVTVDFLIFKLCFVFFGVGGATQ